MKNFGLIGKTLKHSFSKKYFTDKFNNDSELKGQHAYELYELETIDKIEPLFKKEGLVGLNVTIPYKEQVIPFLDELDEGAQAIGAVNTITISKKADGTLFKKGSNTDFVGFKNDILDFINPDDLKTIDKALVFGTGGASKAIKYALETIGMHVTLVGRKTELNYESLKAHPEILKASKLLVNTTPLGTWPEVDQKVDLPYQALTEQHYLYDLVYNPSVTAFLHEGICTNSKMRNGYNMLVGQAEASWEIWNSK